MKASAQTQLRSELFGEIADVTARAAMAQGVAEDAAQAVSLAVCDALATNFGGATVYLPRDCASQIAERDAALLRCVEIEGKTPQELSLQFGICVQAVYKVIARARARRRVPE
jgi:Mor family transcriptional regulator